MSDGQKRRAGGPSACAGSGGRRSSWPPSSWRWCGWWSRSARGSWSRSACSRTPTGGGSARPSSRRRCRWARWRASSAACSGVGGSRISLAGVVATTYAGNAISVGLPLAGPAAATLFAMRRFVDLGAEASVAGWALAVSGVFSSFALVAVVALGAVVSGSGLAVVSAAVGVLGGAVPLAVLLLSLRRPGPRRLLERLGTRLVAGAQKVSGHPRGRPRGDRPGAAGGGHGAGAGPADAVDRGTARRAELAGRRGVPGVRDPGRRRRRPVGGAPARVGGGHGGGLARADPGRPGGRRGGAELGADRDGTGRVDGDRGRARLPDREPVAGARGGRAHAAGARRPEARPVRRRDRRPGRSRRALTAEGPRRVSGGPPSAWPPTAGARCRRAAAGPACP